MASTWDGRGNVLDAQGGSHGNSLVVAPDGNILARAPSFGECIVLQDLDLRLASSEPSYMPHAFMQPFYDAGAKLLSSMPVD
jgi:predicted amidohydrolase